MSTITSPLSGCGCAGNNLSGVVQIPAGHLKPVLKANSNGYMSLGELTDAEAMAIIKTKLTNLGADKITAIAFEAASGKWDTLGGIIHDITVEVCTAGATAKISDAMKQYWYVVVFGAFALMYFGHIIFKVLSKGKGKGRGK